MYALTTAKEMTEMNPAVMDFASTVQLCVSVGTLITLVKVLRKPEVTQNEKLANLDTRVSNIEARLGRGSQHFTEIDSANEVTQKALLAILGHDISGNNEKELRDAQSELNEFLTKRHQHHEDI